MIIGIGTDIIETRRIQGAIERSGRFIERIFTEAEAEYLKSRNFRTEFIAGRFAAKEAVAKALGTGFRGFNFRDIEINRDEFGRPTVVLTGRAKEIAESHGTYKIHVSISHSQDNAIAYAILEV